MKIISKRKDYYDYLAGVYGIDPLKVYDRRAEHYGEPGGTDELNPLLEHYDFAVCGMMHRIYQYKGKFYQTKLDWVNLEYILRKDNNHVGRLSLLMGSGIREMERDAARMYKRFNVPTDVNKVLRQPVLMKTSGGGEFDYKGESSWSKVILKDFNFHRIIGPEVMFQKIGEFLGWLVDNPPIPNKQTNIEKLQSHGFDKKISFRHRK